MTVVGWIHSDFKNIAYLFFTLHWGNTLSLSIVPEFGQSREGHVVPQHSGDVLQLLNPLPPFPQGDVGGGEKTHP